MELILIRHLKTPGNEKRQYIGSTDEALSDREIQKFHESGRKEHYPQVQQVITSPMKRCIQTAELIYPERKVRIEPLLRECDFGSFEGKTYEELKGRPEYQAWLDSGGTTAFPEGEEQTEFRSRCVEGMIRQVSRLCEEKVERAAAIVHGGTIMAVLERLSENGEDFYHWQAENGGGYLVRVEETEWKSGHHLMHDIQKLKEGEETGGGKR